jgi:uncharacterized protein (DUF885 family)
LTDILVHYLLLAQEKLSTFKTVKDYENWLKRIEGFKQWADTAIANFDKGIAIGMVLPKTLVVK